MKLNDLKRLCKLSLELYYEIENEELNIDSGRTVLYKTVEENLRNKKLKLKKIESLLREYAYLFETDIKTLKNAIWSDVYNKNISFTIKELEVDKINCDKNKCNGNLIKYELLLCRNFKSLPIVKFVSLDDVTSCENSKINLLEEGFVKSCIIKTRVEELKKNISNFECLMWGIVENNLEKLKKKTNINNKEVDYNI